MLASYEVLTEPCPAKSDGSAHRCFSCAQNIAVGAPAIDFGRHGYSHSKCPVTTGSGDAASGGRDLQAFLRDSQALGPREPATGLRRGQDLQDAVAERLLENRGGHR